MVIYLICSFHDTSIESSSQNECVERFTKKRSYLDTNFGVIYTNTYKFVYHFKLKDEESNSIDFDVLYKV